jgi:hypothetical protein
VHGSWTAAGLVNRCAWFLDSCGFGEPLCMVPGQLRNSCTAVIFVFVSKHLGYPRYRRKILNMEEKYNIIAAETTGSY